MPSFLLTLASEGVRGGAFFPELKVLLQSYIFLSLNRKYNKLRNPVDNVPFTLVLFLVFSWS